MSGRRLFSKGRRFLSEMVKADVQKLEQELTGLLGKKTAVRIKEACLRSFKEFASAKFSCILLGCLR